MDMNLSATISLMANVVIAAVAVVSATIAFISLHSGHLRRKKQSTIEYYTKLSNENVLPLRRAIAKTLGEPLIKPSYKVIYPSSRKWRLNEDLQEKFVAYVRAMDRFAVGIRLKIFDYDTFYRIAGKSTGELYNQIRRLICEAEVPSQFPQEFCMEYELLCKKLLDTCRFDKYEKQIKKNALRF
jgi:hypothetical protein